MLSSEICLSGYRRGWCLQVPVPANKAQPSRTNTDSNDKINRISSLHRKSRTICSRPSEPILDQDRLSDQRPQYIRPRYARSSNYLPKAKVYERYLDLYHETLLSGLVNENVNTSRPMSRPARCHKRRFPLTLSAAFSTDLISDTRSVWSPSMDLPRMRRLDWLLLSLPTRQAQRVAISRALRAVLSPSLPVHCRMPPPGVRT